MQEKICLSVIACLILFGQSSNANAAPLKSSIQTSYSRGPEAQEEVNTPRLKKLAKVTAQQAKDIARKRFKGIIKQVDLENEDGNVIWSVEIGKHELSIDAGNGNILALE
jgi:uncharacterized membrane protein YkoI